MKERLENLSRMQYPGRVIILGRDKCDEQNIVIYAITGRSLSSQARKLELEADMVWTKPTDTAKLQKGNIDLLIYPAITFSDRIAVSNGRQTLDIMSQSGRTPAAILEAALKNWDYEPDAPIFTPRISGCITKSSLAALSLIKRAKDGSSARSFFEVPLTPGKGKLISTYCGENKDPLKAFDGGPLEVELQEKTSRQMAEAVYEALRPDKTHNDYRVALACVFAKKSNPNNHQLSIINRQERKRP